MEYKMTGIKQGVYPSLFEIGKIKIGIKGQERKSKNQKTFRQPQKLDHFLVVSNVRDSSDNFVPHPIMKDLGEHPTELGIRLLFDDWRQNLFTQYRYQGVVNGKSKKVCYGDGVKAYRYDPETKKEKLIDCKHKDCEFFYKNTKDGRGCKWYGVLTCLLENVNVVGGCFKYRTTSEIAINSMITSMLDIYRTTGGFLANIPLKLVLDPITVSPERLDGSVKLHVVHIEYKGSRQDLANVGIELHSKKIEEQGKWKKLGVNKPLLTAKPIEFETEQDLDDLTAEFFHDNKIVEDELVVKKPKRKLLPAKLFKKKGDNILS